MTDSRPRLSRPLLSRPLLLGFLLAVACALAQGPAKADQAENVYDGQVFRGVTAMTDQHGPYVAVAHNEEEWETLWHDRLNRDMPAVLPEGHIAVAAFAGDKATTGFGVRLVHNEDKECSSCPNYVDFFETIPSAMSYLRYAQNSPYEVIVIETPKQDVEIHYHKRLDTAYMPQPILWTLPNNSDTFSAYEPAPSDQYLGYAAGDSVENVDEVYVNAPTNEDQAMKDGKIAESDHTRTYDTHTWDYVSTYDNSGHAAWVAR